MRKNRYRCKRYRLFLPKVIGEALDTEAEYVVRLIGPAVVIVPKGLESLMVQVEGQMRNNTSADGAQASLYYGTGSAPANQAAITGTQKGKPAIMDEFYHAS